MTRTRKTHHSSFIIHHSSFPRHGVLLLMVLALLAIFGLIAVAFVVLTSHAKWGALCIERIDRVTDPPQKLLQQAVMQVLRGPNITPGVESFTFSGGDKMKPAFARGNTLQGPSNPFGTITAVIDNGDTGTITVDMTSVSGSAACAPGDTITSPGGKTAIIDTVGNGGSVMGAHSLLEDIYGNGSVTGTIANVTPRCNGQLFDFTFTPTGGATTRTTCVGCVITVIAPTTSPAYGRSSRIVGFSPTGDPITGPWQMLTFDGAQPQNNDTVVINGVPFSGTGFGYNPGVGANPPTMDKKVQFNVSGTVTDCEVALLPNLSLSVNYNATDNTLANPPGGANSDYTAPDCQHVLLAAQVPNAAVAGGIQTLPSLLRPSLLNYWINRVPGATDLSGLWTASPDLCRSIIMRPIGPMIGIAAAASDHPNFTGSNASFDPRHIDSLDVDNDGDGVTDSVWVDLGMPVRSTADGRLYKPLFAILCTDLDGRLNLNAHGSLAQTDSHYYTPSSQSGGAFAGLVTPVFRGQGLGPAEINLQARVQITFTGGTPANAKFALNDTITTTAGGDGKSGVIVQTDNGDATGTITAYLTGNSFVVGDIIANATNTKQATVATVMNAGILNYTQYQQLLTGIAGGYEGRYGSTKVPGLGAADYLNLNKWFEYGQRDYWGALSTPDVNNAGSYGSPPDPFGVGTVGLNPAGQPLYVGMQYGGLTYLGYGCGTNENPYQINLAPKISRGLPSGTPNNPFSIAELERLLRPYDRDATTLPSRLAVLAPSLLPPNLYGRLRVTTESWDVPAPATQLIPATAPGHATETLISLLLQKGVVNRAAAVAMLTTLFPPDLLAGLKMNINRPFGNGLAHENNNDSFPYIVDAPETLPNPTKQVSLNGTNYDVSYDGICYPTVAGGVPALSGGRAANPIDARQLEARYLYVLAALLVDTDGLKAQLKAQFGGTPTGEDVARYLAQWAINVVSFRDRDAIMTRFDYDPNFAYANDPLHKITGWVLLNDNKHTVWGCKRPELLISETIAFHDRRTEDRSTDTTGSNHDTANGDPNFDQRFQPQGSLFVELYNPWTVQDPKPWELCCGFGATYGVDLTKLSGQDPTTGLRSPVWRMITVSAGDATKDPDYWDPTDATNLPTIERAVYFVAPGTQVWDNTKMVVLPTDCSVQLYPDNYDGNDGTTSFAAEIAPIVPGAYAVIGPGDPTEYGSTTTCLGFKTNENPGNADLTATSTTRRIVLTPDFNGGAANQVMVYNDGTTNDLAGLSTRIQSPTSVVINQPFRLNISEPDDAYASGGTYNPTTGYATPIDTPQDVGGSLQTQIFNNGRTDNVKVIHLQRLANPTVPWDNTPTSATYNPYRTIDTMPIDLTAFNGINNTDITKQTSPLISSNNNDKFYARQRGQYTSNLKEYYNLWRQEPATASPYANATTTDLPPTIPGGFNFLAALNHTLGFLNDPFGAPNVSPYKGDPLSPFPWLTWNNRPFANQLELLLVPALKSRDLLMNYDLWVAASAPAPYTKPLEPFPQLLDFFYSDKTAGKSTQLHRLLEYVGVPSQFACADIQADPSAAQINAGHAFHPPFNRISNYREPGRINLNTIYSEEVFNGLMNGFPFQATGGSIWERFKLSRRGYDGGAYGNIIFAPNTGYPSAFSHPFRSYAGGQMVPKLTPTDVLTPTPEINATLLREDPVTAGTPLFQYASTNDVDNTNRNPYFRYQGLERLGNLVTTRSNLYAVWITVGYFEVTPVTPANPAIYPDGYQLGRELGVDTGEIERHRAFYIIDRTIPVGFQRGQDLNADKAILLNRFIE